MTVISERNEEVCIIEAGGISANAQHSIKAFRIMTDFK